MDDDGGATDQGSESRCYLASMVTRRRTNLDSWLCTSVGCFVHDNDDWVSELRYASLMWLSLGQTLKHQTSSQAAWEPAGSLCMNDFLRIGPWSRRGLHAIDPPGWFFSDKPIVVINILCSIFSTKPLMSSKEAE